MRNPKVEKLPTFKERYKALNKAQKRAVDTTDGPVMVIAGPGSGKTELLALRIGNILKEGTAKASSILCLTFTETAALNMRERLESLIGADAYRVAIYTFHSFCTDVIGRYGEYFYDGGHFRPASDLVQSEILESIFERLPHKHLLGSFHRERGYSYLKDVQSKIKDIKKGGLTADRFRELLKENEKAFVELNKIISKHLPERIGKDSILSFEKMKEELKKTKTNLGEMYARGIDLAMDECEKSESNTSLSLWKTQNTGKDLPAQAGEEGKRVFKDYLALPKLFALTDIYEMYQERLQQDGYFDYEDMILQVLIALEKNVTLRTELEEMYQYIMVDEFQDTNNAQLSLVKAISSNKVHEGHPNVCVVGDDDQAIYKFQGAEISNIHSFKELYKDVEVIVLTENYRSTQKVLDFARSVVIQGVNRLENHEKDIRKDLVAKNKELPKGDIHIKSFRAIEEEYTYVAEEVAKLLKSKVEAKEIAIISRKHDQFITLLPYLDVLSVPYTYTRKENVFDEAHVKELITICKFLASVGDKSYERDDLLPEILSFSFWGINRINIWQIAEYAKRENISWLSAMQKSDDKIIKALALFLIELGVAAQTTPLEIILDTLIGSKEVPLTPETEEEDENVPFVPLHLKTYFTSPYKEYYFGKSILKKSPSNYINFLSSLRVFMHALREWKEGESLRARDVEKFVQMHIDYNIALTNDSPFAHNENSISLLTAHGAKGLEFSHVFIVGVNDDIWAGRLRGSKLNFPINIPLGSAGDSEDDFIRLFYVALTRARHTLYITHHKSSLRFLTTNEEKSSETEEGKQTELLAHGLKVYHMPPFAKDEKALLQKVVEGYMLPVTHLNNFLDITKGGPLLFLEQNLLRFPQAKTPSSVYGTAVHKAIEDAHIFVRKGGKLPSIEKVIETFRKELKRGRLQDFEEEKQRVRGEKILKQYFELKKAEIKKENIVEMNFAKQSVLVGDAILTGKIDKVIINDDQTWTVVDFKTGKGFSNFDEKRLTKYDEIKLHHYRYQLMMYKLLVENSRDHNNKKVGEGVLEFVEEEVDGKVEEIRLSFEDKNMKDELFRFKRLVSAVYEKIVTLDFPDTSAYSQTLDGIKQFEEDLISGKI